MDRNALADLQARIEALREAGEDCLILAVGVRGPNIDCPDGNAVATVSMGDEAATSEAVHLHDAILLARGKILRARAAREEKRAKEKAERTAIKEPVA